MKQIFSISIILFSMLLMNTSCSKEIPDTMVMAVQHAPDQIINTDVSVDKTYTLNIANLGEVKISKQAVHFAISQTEIDVKDRTPVYKYIPAAGFTGSDEVELFSSKIDNSNSGACNNGGVRHTTVVASIVIKFTITK